MTGEWNEAEHPRDEEGKFTYKGNGDVGTKNSEDRLQNRADVLYPTMKRREEKKIRNSYTGGAARIVRDEINGVKKGEERTLEEAIGGVNPDYNI